MRRVAFVRMIPLLILSGFLVVPAGSAHADEVGVVDAKDAISTAYPNALDIHYATMAHAGNKLTHTITLFRKLNPAWGLTGGYYIGVAFDTDGDYSDAERLLYIFSLDGGLRGQMANGAGKKVGAIFAVKHPSPSTASATFSAKLLGNPSRLWMVRLREIRYWHQVLLRQGAEPQVGGPRHRHPGYHRT